MSQLFKFWQKWKYKYLSMVFLSVIFSVFLSQHQGFHDWLISLGSIEYLGAFIAGTLFVSSFTTATSIVVIAILSENIHPLALGLIGGVGALFGDLLIFKLVRDHLTDELTLLFGPQETSHVKALIRSKYIAWLLPIIGGLIIASPLPDELGVSLLGVSKMDETKFMLISYWSNAIGILMIASVAAVL